MFQEYFQLYTIIVSSKSWRNCHQITIPDNYRLITLYSYVARGSDIGSGAHRSPVDVAATCQMLRHKTFWFNLSHRIKRPTVADSGMTLVPRYMINDDSDKEWNSDVESDIEVNVGEEVNVSYVVPFSE